MLLNAGVIGASAGGGAWTPANLTTALWLDSSDSATLFDATTGGSLPAADGGVARWEDKSGNARHFTQATSGQRPIRKVALQNGLDGVQFDGTNDFLEAVFSQAYTAQTVFAVFRYTGSTAYQRVYSQVGSTGADFSDPSTIPIIRNNATNGFCTWASSAERSSISLAQNTFCIFSHRHSGTSLQNAINATSGASFTHSLSLTATLHRIGWLAINGSSADTSYFSGDLCEIIVLSSNASTDEFDKVHGYLAHKWGLTADLPGDHPYKTVAP